MQGIQKQLLYGDSRTKKGVSIFFQDINKDTASFEDSLLLKLLLTLSEEESRNISERTKWGNEASAKANKIRNN